MNDSKVDGNSGAAVDKSKNLGKATARAGVRMKKAMKSFSRVNTITAIDFDSQKLHVAQAINSRNKIAVTRIAAETLPTDENELNLDDPQATGTWLAGALRRLKIRPGHVVMGIPRGKVVLKPLTLPAADDMHELASMVYYQVGKDLPFDPEDAIIDFTIQSHYDAAPPTLVVDDDGKGTESRGDAPAASRVEVLAAAVKRDVVDAYKLEAAAAGLKLHALGLRSYGNVRCVELCEGAASAQSVALVFLRPDEVIIDVLKEKSLAFSRAATIDLSHSDGSEQAPEATTTRDGSREAPEATSSDHGDLTTDETRTRDEVIESVAKEVARSLRIYGGSSPPHAQIAKVLVAGETGMEWMLATILADRLELPCSILDPATKLGLKGDSKEHARSAIAVVGLAIGAGEPDGLPFDFLHPRRPAVRRNRPARRKMLVAACIIATLLGTLVVRDRILKSYDDEHTFLLKQIEQQKEQSNYYKKQKADAKTVQNWLAGDRKWLNHWSYLSGVLPDCTEVYVTNVTTSPSGTIRMSLQAKSGEILGGLDEQLREAGYEVSPMEIRPTEDRYEYGFRTTVELRVPANMKIDLEKAQPPPRPSDDASLETAAWHPSSANDPGDTEITRPGLTSNRGANR